MKKDNPNNHPVRCLHSSTFKTVATVLVPVLITLGLFITSYESKQDDRLGVIDNRVLKNEQGIATLATESKGIDHNAKGINKNNHSIGIIESKSVAIEKNTALINDNRKLIGEVQLDYLKAMSNLTISITKLNGSIKSLERRIDIRSDKKNTSSNTGG